MPPKTKSTPKKRDFDPKEFLATIGEGRRAVLFANKTTIFTQGDAADAVFYIHGGQVRLTVVSKSGKEATVGILNSGDFFRRRCPGWTVSTYGVGKRDDGL